MPTPFAIEWVRYSPQQVLMDLLGLSPQAELAHRRLSDLVWSCGTFPNSTPALCSRLARVPVEGWPTVLAELRSIGWRTRGTMLMHTGVLSVRQEAIAYYRSVAKRGARGAAVSNRRFESAKPTAQPRGKRAKSAATAQGVDPKEKKLTKAVKTAERSALSPPAPNGASLRGEQAYLEEVRQVLCLASPMVAKTELENWGGWWRNRYRENARKARTVLADVAGMIRERRVVSNPGAAALDLWNRLP